MVRPTFWLTTSSWPSLRKIRPRGPSKPWLPDVTNVPWEAPVVASNFLTVLSLPSPTYRESARDEGTVRSSSGSTTGQAREATGERALRCALRACRRDREKENMTNLLLQTGLRYNGETSIPGAQTE